MHAYPLLQGSNGKSALDISADGFEGENEEEIEMEYLFNRNEIHIGYSILNKSTWTFKDVLVP